MTVVVLGKEKKRKQKKKKTKTITTRKVESGNVGRGYGRASKCCGWVLLRAADGGDYCFSISITAAALEEMRGRAGLCTRRVVGGTAIQEDAADIVPGECGDDEARANARADCFFICIHFLLWKQSELS